MDLDRARVIADVGQVIVNSAKVEVDFAKVTGTRQSLFLAPSEAGPGLPAPTHDRKQLPPPGNGIKSITQHTLKG
ncbi:hypothetical protein [Rhodoferax sp.]|uniref:hypothetical protein n=1 Tax=Rhodoferax sp. TaxID=50421 RepID=UPI002765E757|nr:hypothetical protein [Rhodoferax sp.]